MSLKLKLACAMLVCSANTGFAFDAGEYRALVARTVESIFSGDVDVGELTDIQHQLVEIGVVGVREFASANSDQATLMNFVADQAPLMSELSLAEIEAAWHDGEALGQVGVDIHDLDHFGPLVSHMDSVVHPATAIIALREYDATGDEQYLEQVVDELSEVVEHLAYLE